MRNMAIELSSKLALGERGAGGGEVAKSLTRAKKGQEGRNPRMAQIGSEMGHNIFESLPYPL